jgi:hypothetical protein
MQQTPAQALGRKGERWFQNAIPKEWIFQKPTEDFGLDGTVMVATSNKLSGLEFGVQVKASANWVQRDGHFIVPGISYGALMRWLSPFLPTALVLYDEPKDQGYYAWVKDISPDVDVLMVSHPKSVTLKVPRDSVLDAGSFKSMEAWINEHFSSMHRAISTKNISASILPTIHHLTHALQLLLMLHAGGMPENPDAEKFQLLADVRAHKTVLSAIADLASHPYMKSPVTSKDLMNYIQRLRKAYSGKVGLFVDLDTLFQDGDVVLMVNREKMISMRPELMYMITQGVTALSSVVRGVACEYCGPRQAEGED